MDVRIRFQGVMDSDWMTRYLESKVARLERYLPTGTFITIVLSMKNEECFTEMKVQTPKHEYVFQAKGCDLFESFTHVLEESTRHLRNEHARLIERIHRKFTAEEWGLL